MNNIFLLAFLLFGSLKCAGQGGVWTWISGDSTVNSVGVYGTQGVPSVSNHPPAMYEYAEWKDKQGNFWLYGGMAPGLSDLWKYAPSTNEWTWVHAGMSFNPIYGTQGIPNPLNTPGQRVYGAATWVDTTGNLWLFGGLNRSDLWKYNIFLNEWTWMDGDTTIGAAAIHGIKGVPSGINIPGARQETCSAWTDSLNNLWIFGGYGYDELGSAGTLNDLMKYDISSSEWTWVSGSNLRYDVNNYGTMGVPSPTNMPGSRQTYTKWKDAQSNFWIMRGSDLNGFSQSDVWRYDISANEWTWMAGTNSVGVYQNRCVYDSVNYPSVRMEHRSSVTDNCGKFWMYGGATLPNIGSFYNDLWVFDSQQLKWDWISGANILNQPGSYGALGVPAATNMPPSCAGGVAWWGNDNRFYLFGGLQNLVTTKYGALWVFTPDTNCVGSCGNSPLAIFSAASPICPGTCANFTNLSTNATSYQWFFTGASPATSTDVNPAGICYNTPGSYDVTLIASNASGSDTLTMNNYITVFPYPPPQGISQGGDTLFANQGAVSYQWYFNGFIISAATNYFYVAQSSGDYNVVATDANGCEVEAVIFNVIASVTSLADNIDSLVQPNPFSQYIKVACAGKISVYDSVGKRLLEKQISSLNQQLDLSYLQSGMYFLRMETEGKVFQRKLIKL